MIFGPDTSILLSVWERVAAVGRSIAQVRRDHDVATGFLIAERWLLVPGRIFPPWPSVGLTSAEFKGVPGAPSVKVLSWAKIASPEDGGGFALALLDAMEGGAWIPDLATTSDASSGVVGTRIFVAHYPLGGAARVSMGTVLSRTEAEITYDASTQGGSSGGPVLDGEGRLVGMHYRALRERQANGGVLLAPLFTRIAREAPEAWAAIVAHHHLVTSVDVAQPISDDAARDARTRLALQETAAVLWEFDPATLRTVSGETPGAAWRLLTRDVTARRTTAGKDSTNARWSLLPSIRLAALRRLATRPALMKARAVTPTATPGTPQAVLDQVLTASATIDLQTFPLADLHVLRLASGWFGAIVTDVPSPALISAAESRRRVMDPIHLLAGDDFRGRAAELLRLDDFITGDAPRGAIVLEGVGGVGKSALIAKFLQGHLGDLAMAWLEFDRPGLSAHNPVGLLTEIRQQVLALHPDAPLPGVEEDTSSDGAKADLAALLAGWGPVFASLGRLLLIIDSAEEFCPSGGAIPGPLAGLLAALQREHPALRVVIGTRVPLVPAGLNGPVEPPIQLGALDVELANAVLVRKGVDDPADRAILVDLARGNPLILQLGATFVARIGPGKLAIDAPERAALTDVAVQGMIYRRILDHIDDDQVRAVARYGLVLRTLTSELIREVLAGPCELTLTDERDLLRRLVATAGLFTPVANDRAACRPEVRRLVLHLLEQGEASRVERIDRAAVTWLSTRSSPWERAEQVYHLLRLKTDRKTLDAAWNDDLREFFSVATLEEIPEAMRPWLAGRGIGARELVTAPEDWEERARRELVIALSVNDKVAMEAILQSAPPVIVDPEVAWLVGVAHLRRSRWSEAVLVATQETYGDTTDPAAHPRLALVAAEASRGAGDLPSALTYLERAREGWPAKVAPPDGGGGAEALRKAEAVYTALALDAEIIVTAREIGAASPSLERARARIGATLETLTAVPVENRHDVQVLGMTGIAELLLVSIRLAGFPYLWAGNLLPLEPALLALTPTDVPDWFLSSAERLLRLSPDSKTPLATGARLRDVLLALANASSPDSVSLFARLLSAPSPALLQVLATLYQLTLRPELLHRLRGDPALE
jgi:hypothetical protein